MRVPTGVPSLGLYIKQKWPTPAKTSALVTVTVRAYRHYISGVQGQAGSETAGGWCYTNIDTYKSDYVRVFREFPRKVNISRNRLVVLPQKLNGDFHINGTQFSKCRCNIVLGV